MNRFSCHPKVTSIQAWLCTLVLWNGVLGAEVIDFENWPLQAKSSWLGPVDAEGSVHQPGPFGGTDRIGTFEVGSAKFSNRYNLDFGSWSGFAISNQTDMTTAGAVNQASAITGGGAAPGAKYAVGFGYVDKLDPSQPEQLAVLPSIELEPGVSASSMLITNTTYAVLSMRTGDRFAKKFGGSTGTDPDYFRLSIYGTDVHGNLLGNTVETFLADYRFDDHAHDFILDTWTSLDLSPLSEAQQLYFNLDSSDSNQSGLTTPAYFAIDNIVLERDLLGDFNEDRSVTSEDADLLCGQISSGQSVATFDINNDGSVSLADLQTLLSLADSRPGDTNLDGLVGFDDFLTLSNTFGNPGSWSQGNFDCDAIVGFQDFLTLSSSFGTGQARVNSVPEPATTAFFLLFAILWALRTKPAHSIFKKATSPQRLPAETISSAKSILPDLTYDLSQVSLVAYFARRE